MARLNLIPPIFTVLVILLILPKVSGQGSSENKSTQFYFLVGPNYLANRGITFNAFWAQPGSGPVSPDFLLENKTKIGYSAGLGLNNNFGRHFALNTRFLWERKRFQVNSIWYNLFDSSGQLDLTYLGTNGHEVSNDYLAISVIPQLLIGKHFNIGTGMYFSRLLKSRSFVKYHYTPPFPPNEFRYNSIMEYDKYDYGFALNAGCTFPYRHVIFTIQLTDSYGLKNVPTSLNKIETTAPWYNNTYSVLLGITLNKVNNRILQKFGKLLNYKKYSVKQD